MLKLNKKGSVIGVIGYIFTLFIWILIWGLVIDPMDYVLDTAMNDTWESLDMGSDTNVWIENYGTYQNLNFKQFAFWGGLIGITLAYWAYSYYMKSQEYIQR